MPSVTKPSLRKGRLPVRGPGGLFGAELRGNIPIDRHPFWFNESNTTGASADATIQWPTGHMADDIGIITLETANEDLISMPSGWDHVPGSPFGVNTPGSTSATKVIAIWKRATSSAEADVVITDVGNHIIGRMFGFRNALQTGSPFDANFSQASVSTPNINASVTTYNITALDALVVSITSNGTDTGVDQGSGWSNANLWNFRRNSFNNIALNGGGITLLTSWLIAGTGATGTTTVVHETASETASIGFAIKPRVDATVPQTYNLSFFSTITPAGALIKQVNQVFASTITPAGALLKQIQKTFTSSITPAGAFLKQIQKAFTSSITPAATLIKQVQKVLTGTTTPAGTLTKQVQKFFSSSITPSGVFTKGLIILRSFTSSITPAGTLIKQVQKPLTGSITPAGTLVKQVQKALVSSITPAGTLVKQIQKALTSAITPAGALLKQINKPFTSSITPSGTLAKQPQKALTSSITPAGTLRRQVNKALTSVITPAGTLVKFTSRFFSSTITPAGVLLKQINKTFTGSITPSGTLRRQINKLLTSSITPSGTLTKNTISGAIIAAARSLWARLRRRALESQPHERDNNLAAAERDRNLMVDLTMTTLQQWPDKGTYEKLAYTMDFVNELAPGETMSAPTVVITVSTDSLVPDAGPALVATSVAVSATKVGFLLDAGLNGVLYVVQVRADTSNAQKLEARALLKVVNATE